MRNVGTKKDGIKLDFWLKELLYTGRDESGVLVEGLSEWNTRPNNVESYAGHGDHIHVEFYP